MGSLGTSNHQTLTGVDLNDFLLFCAFGLNYSFSSFPHLRKKIARKWQGASNSYENGTLICSFQSSWFLSAVHNKEQICSKHSYLVFKSI